MPQLDSRTRELTFPSNNFCEPFSGVRSHFPSGKNLAIHTERAIPRPPEKSVPPTEPSPQPRHSRHLQHSPKQTQPVEPVPNCSHSRTQKAHVRGSRPSQGGPVRTCTCTGSARAASGGGPDDDGPAEWDGGDSIKPAAGRESWKVGPRAGARTDQSSPSCPPRLLSPVTLRAGAMVSVVAEVCSGIFLRVAPAPTRFGA